MSKRQTDQENNSMEKKDERILYSGANNILSRRAICEAFRQNCSDMEIENLQVWQ